jgi:hypothetical protein
VAEPLARLYGKVLPTCWLPGKTLAVSARWGLMLLAGVMLLAGMVLLG